MERLILNKSLTKFIRNCTTLQLGKPTSVTTLVNRNELGPTSVAAQVHADTIPEAIRPGFILRDALVNSSEFLGENAV